MRCTHIQNMLGKCLDGSRLYPPPPQRPQLIDVVKEFEAAVRREEHGSAASSDRYDPLTLTELQDMRDLEGELDQQSDMLQVRRGRGVTGLAALIGVGTQVCCYVGGAHCHASKAV